MVEYDDPATLTDAKLLSAYSDSSGDPGHPLVDCLLAEIEKHPDL